MNARKKQMTKTLYRKLLDAHTVARLDSDNVLLFADLHLMNEYISLQAFARLAQRGLKALVPDQNVAPASHIIPTRPDAIRVIQDPASGLQAR